MPTTRAVTITKTQAALLAQLQGAVTASQERMHVAVSAIIGGHDIASAADVSLDGTTLTMTVLDEDATP